MGLENLDGFFLTAPLATPDLKRIVEDLREELSGLEVDYQTELTRYAAMMSKLTKMESKTKFVHDEIVKATSVFTPPPPGEEETVFDVLDQHVYQPMAYIESGIGGAGGALWLVGKAGPKTFHALSKIGRISGIANKVGKSARWTKVARFGSKLGALAVAFFIVDFGIQLSTASKINAHFRENETELKTQIKKAGKAVQDVKDVVAEGDEVVQQILDETGAASVDDYVRIMNEGIAAIGEQAANFGAARRMLLDGLASEMVARYIPGLPQEALETLEKKLDAERALASGASDAEVSDSTGLTLVQVAGISKLQRARMSLLSGGTVEEVAEATALSTVVVTGEDEMLHEDLQMAWKTIAERAQSSAISARILVSREAVAQFYKQLDAKARLFEGVEPGTVATTLEIDDAARVDGWAEDLAVARKAIGLLKATAPQARREDDLAADFLLPVSIVRAIPAAAA
ncbi:hypothetical protein KCG44_08675 [Pacificimonas sp. WHA3]|uniref:Uncharacterized protein n=1 Tax=Pacificimonas pallii TaxID=2827236 RepID=A0ABS6SEQ5_9SPHN|nr:hypothetical protein [Pacificimonas pallii]MBV7256859.1 hypothetical protein [Pacificimonas pallii]